MTPDVCQGQIVEYSYAGTADSVLMRIYDRSDMTTLFYVARLTDDDWEWYEAWEPWEEPDIADKRWAKIDEDAAWKMIGGE